MSNDILCTGCDYRDVEMQKLKQELATVKEQQRWIPVSERLPELDLGRHIKYDEVMVLVHRKDGTVEPCLYHGGCTAARWQGFTTRPDDVTHWMPLPAPPTTQEECISHVV